ncbi:unnamed protein product, partial [Ectocarpus sp. 4 AP-2014]
MPMDLGGLQVFTRYNNITETWNDESIMSATGEGRNVVEIDVEPCPVLHPGASTQRQLSSAGCRQHQSQIKHQLLHCLSNGTNGIFGGTQYPVVGVVFTAI